MSAASRPADARGESWIERWQHRIAALLSALLHVLFVLLAMWLSPPMTVTPPQGTAAGSRMAVDFIGQTPPQPMRTPLASQAAASKAAVKPRVKSRVQTTRVTQADEPVSTHVVDASDSPEVPPVPQDAPAQATQGRAQAPAASRPPTPPRRAHTWGQPPGMLQENLAPENAGLARSSSLDRGRSNDASAGEPSLEVGGYQVYYDLRAEARLRAWRDRGMTEIFLPMPGTRRLMACPLETALKRESGPCRLIEADAPELKDIGDAREVIDMQKVYRQGELVWGGSGPYR